MTGMLGKLQFASGLGPGMLVLIFLVCAGLVLLFYHRVYTFLGGPIVWTLVGMRLLAIAILLILIFRPVLSFEEHTSRKMRLYILVDTSGSMSVKDAPNSLNRLADAVARVENHMDALEEKFRVWLYTFDTRVREHTEGEEWPEAEGVATNLIQPISYIDKIAPKGDTAGIVLMSDGIHNAGGNVIEAIKDVAQLPICTVAMGSTLGEESGFQDIGIERVDAAAEAIVDNLTQVRVSISQSGLTNRATRVELREKGQVLDSQALVLTSGPPQTVTLSFTPTVRGRHTYEVFIPQDPDERIVENNTHNVNILVTSPSIRVLYIEGVLRPEFRSLNRVLQTDPNVEAVSLVQIRPGGKFTQLGGAGKTRAVGFPQTAEEMDKFDVFIIGSLDRTYMSANQMKILKEAVREGKGLLMLGGQTSFGPGGYQGTPIEEILPVQVGPRSIGQEMSLFVMKLTAEGANHLIFSGVQKFFQGGMAEGTKPLLTGCVVLGAPKPGASILAVHPERKGPAGGNLIVLAVHQYGDGRTAAFAGDTTWRWDIPLKALGRESPYVKFWGQMVRWLAGRDVKERSTEPGVDLVLRKPMYDLGDTVSVKAQVREAEGRATNFADIISTVIAPNQGRIPLNLGNVPGAVGLYEGEFVVEEPGAYRVVVEARKDGVRLGLAQADFTVGRRDAEFERLGTDIKVLQEIADISKGRLFAPANFGDIIDFLGTKEISEEQHREVKLYHLPTMFFVFLALITTEWLIRRYHQLN